METVLVPIESHSTHPISDAKVAKKQKLTNWQSSCIFFSKPPCTIPQNDFNEKYKQTTQTHKNTSINT